MQVAETATPPKATSDLCKPLPSVLTDSSSVSMLDYFIQYMEKERAIQLVQFWLSVEAFKSTPHQDSLGGSPDTTAMKCSGVPSTSGWGDTLTGSGTSSEVNHSSVTSSGKDSRISAICDGTAATEMGHTATNGLGCTATDGPNDAASVVEVLPRLLSKQGNLSVATDAIEIYTTYIALNALSPVGVPPNIRQQIEVNICPEDGVINRLCFREAQNFVYHTLESRYFPAFLRSSFLCKYQLEYISSGNLCLLDFLLADNALFYFMEFMEQEGASSLVQFWLMADNFQRHLSEPQHVANIDLDTADAIGIYDRFFSLQASDPLLMGDTIRMDIENRICSEQGPRPDSFSQAQDKAYQTMSQTFYPNFLRSSIYLRFLNELVHMLNASTSHETKDKPDVATKTKPVPEWREDLDDPDTLWRRPHLPMRMGYVDQFGQYTSEVECMIRDTTKAGMFTWLMRNRQQEEELTMRIAVNIVSEVMESVKRKDISNTNIS